MTTNLAEKLAKRRCFPVTMEDGSTRHVMPLLSWDKLAMNSLDAIDAKYGFAIGRCLVNENGGRCFERGAKESPAEFSMRVREETPELEYGDLVKLLEAINKVTNPPKAETLLGNSEPTGTPAS
jgi:hypothetical protein